MDHDNFTYDKPHVIKTIKNYSEQYNKIQQKNNKILLTKYFICYLISVNQFIIDHPKFALCVINKIKEIRNEINELITFSNNNILYLETIQNMNYLLQLIDLH